jgi:hypothetical protein
MGDIIFLQDHLDFHCNPNLNVIINIWYYDVNVLIKPMVNVTITFF